MKWQTRRIIPSIEFSRRPWRTRKYFDEAMLTLVSDQEVGAWIPFCSKMTFPSAFLITASWVLHWTVSKAVLPRGTRRGTGIGSRPMRGTGREEDSSGEVTARFLAIAIIIHSRRVDGSSRPIGYNTHPAGT